MQMFLVQLVFVEYLHKLELLYQVSFCLTLLCFTVVMMNTLCSYVVFR